MTHPDESEPMPRLLLALCLYCVAALTIAGPPVATDDDAAAKPDKPAATSSAGDNDATPPPPAPARSRNGASTRPAVPRWHSRLPGMIR